MGHVGGTISDDLAFHSVVAVRIVRHVVFDGEAVLSRHKRGQFQILGAHRRAWTPTCAVVDPSPPLRVQRVVRTLLHDFPTPLLRVVHFHAVGVVAEFCAVVSLAKVVATGTRLQTPHFFALSGRIGLRQNGGIPVVQVMDAFPERGHIFHVTWRCPLNESKLQIEQLLPVATLQLHAVFQERGVIGDVKHPRPTVGTQCQVDAIPLAQQRQ